MSKAFNLKVLWGGFMIRGSLAQNIGISMKTLNIWFEEQKLMVAPYCNIMCNFCSKDSDCICNGNDPGYLSKSMTPRQAVNWAVNSASKNKRVKIIKISGPGEPLYNFQVFETLRRLNSSLEDCILCICTNGLLLKEKAREISQLNVKIVEVSINAVFADSFTKLYSRIVNNGDVLSASAQTAEYMLKRQFEGIEACLELGMEVKVNTVYFPGINDRDIMEISNRCLRLGINHMCIISGSPRGKFRGIRMPTLAELASVQQEVSKIIPEVEIKSFIPY